MPDQPSCLPRTRVRLWLLALALSTSAGAQARDVELYERPDFRGTRLTLDSATPNLQAYGAGGQVSSVVVLRGQWEFCTQPQFRGACVTVGPGRYGRLPPALNDNLASLRPAGARPPDPRPTRPRPPEPTAAAAIVLHAGNFSGPELRLNDAVPDLARKAFNDTATTVDVLGGLWELCSDGGFEGQCLRFGPGRHALPPALRDRLSSLRPVNGAGRPDRPDRPGRPDRPDRPDDNHGKPWPGARPALVLHEHRDGSGREVPLMSATPSLGALGFNDRASSVEISRGRWQLCRHDNYEGDCIVLGPGRHNLDGQLNDEVSSARPLYGRDDRPMGREGAVILHDQLDLRGRSVQVDEEVRNLRDVGFNDRARAIEVHGGRWELCSASNFRERCMTFGPGWHRLPEGLAGEVSSLRPR